MTPYPDTPPEDFPETVGSYPGSDWTNSLRGGESYAPAYFVTWVIFGGSTEAFRASLALGSWMTPPYRIPLTGKIYQIFCNTEDRQAYHGYHYPDEPHNFTNLQFSSGQYYCGSTPLSNVYSGDVVTTIASAGAKWNELAWDNSSPSGGAISNVTSMCNPSGEGYVHSYTWEIGLYHILWYIYDDTPTSARNTPLVIPLLIGAALLIVPSVIGLSPIAGMGVSNSASNSAGNIAARRRRKN